MLEEMCAAYWRQRRAWAIETALLDKQIALQPGETAPERMASAFDRLAAAPTLPLLHRYEARLHLMYQRALRTFIMLRTVRDPNDPSPISEHPPDAIAPGAPAVGQPPPPPRPATDSGPLSTTGLLACRRAKGALSGLSAGYSPSHAAASTATHVPAKPLAAVPAAPPVGQASWPVLLSAACRLIVGVIRRAPVAQSLSMRLGSQTSLASQTI
jgi:hypothetical protein